MDRAFKSGAAATPPTPPAAPSIGYPSPGDAGAGVPPTKMGAWWVHMITEELRNIVVAGGLTPSQASVNQVVSALQAMFVGAASFIGSNQSLATSGYQKFPGGLILQWGAATAAASSTASVTFPIVFPSAIYGVVVSVIPGDTTVTSSGGAVNGATSLTGFVYANTNTNGAAASFWLAIGK